MPPKLIAICAPCMGSGKTELALHLIKNHGFMLIKFAGGVKAMAYALLAPIAGADEAMAMIEGPLKEEPSDLLMGRSPRHLMQTLGTEWGRDQMHPDFWVNLAMAQVDHFLARGRSVVMDDMRFPNELEAVRQRAGALVRVIRQDRPGYAQHRSEGDLADERMIDLNNHKGVDFLRQMGDELAKGTYTNG